MQRTLAAILCILAATPAVAARPELIVDIDFNDEVIIRPEPITEAEVKKLVEDLHAGGVQTLLVRMGYLGYFPYRTKLSYPVGFDPEHARRHPYQRNLDPKKLEQFIHSRQRDNARYRKVVETFNPPEVFVREGHRLGMKVVFWLDIFDDGYSGHRSKFIDEHPHCQWTARDGKTRFEGLISYAWPESRASCVAQAKRASRPGGRRHSLLDQRPLPAPGKCAATMPMVMNCRWSKSFAGGTAWISARRQLFDKRPGTRSKGSS